MRRKQCPGKKMAALLLCAVLAAMPCQQVFAKDVTVQIDGVTKTDVQEPVNERGYMLLDGKELARLLKLEAQWNPEEKTLTLSDKTVNAQFKDGNSSYTVNGEKRYLPVTAKNTSDTLMLPIRQVCEAFGAKVSWNATSRTVGIKTAGEEAAKTGLSLLTQARAGARKIAYRDALAIVIAENSDIKNLLDNIELVEELRDEYLQVYNEIDATIDPSKRVQGGESFLTWLKGFSATEISLISTRLLQEVNEVTCEFMLYSSFSQIKTMEMDIILMKENLELGRVNWSNMVKKNTVGMASDSELRKAKQELDKTEISLGILENGLQGQRVGLNQLLHVGANDVIEVTYTPKIVDLTTNIESYSLGKIMVDPRIKILEESLRQAEYDLAFFDEVKDPTKSSKLELENKVKKAERTLDDTKVSMDKAVRSTYFSLKSLSEKQDSLAIDLQKAKDAYNNVLASLEAGQVTTYEVNQAKAAILKAEVDMAKNLYSFDQMYFSFQHPFLLLTSSQ